MTMARGSFEVTLGGEDTLDEHDGIRLTHASGGQTFTGDIEGVGAIDWLMLYRPDRTAHFVGLQRISGSIGGRHGAFVIAAEGDHDGSSSTIAWTVIPGSGTGELAGISGAGQMVAGGKTGTYELEYRLES